MSSSSSSNLSSSMLSSSSFSPFAVSRHSIVGRPILLLCLLVLALSSLRTSAAKPQPSASAYNPAAAAAAMPFPANAVIDVPFQMEDGQSGELILEPVADEAAMAPSAAGSRYSAWVLPQRQGQKRGSLGPRPLRFGRR